MGSPWRARLRHRLHALLGGGVDEVHGRPRGAGQRDGPAEGQRLRQLGVDEVEVRPLHALLLAEALVVELDEVLVLAVDDHEAARGRHLLHGVVDAAEVDAVARALGVRRQDIGGEDLEGGKSRLDGFGDLLEDPERQGPRERDVEGVVHVGLPLPARGAPLDHGQDVAGVGADIREVHVGGGAAAGHALGILLGPESLRRLLRVRHDRVREVRVWLHPARRDDLPARVDDARGLGGQGPRRGDGDDASPFNARYPRRPRPEG